MREALCIRCQQTVVLQDGQLVYCSHCGAPQIFLAEELQQEMEDKARSYFEENAAAQANAGSVVTDRPRTTNAGRPFLNAQPGETAWTLAVRCALLSGAIALGLGFLSLALPPVGILMFAWLLAAPMLTVAFFNMRALPGAPQASSLPARLGLLTGTLLVACCAVLFVLSMVLSRFVFHDAATLDAQLAANFAQQRTILLSRLGPEVQPTVDLFAIPEYRVGLLLSVAGTCSVFYLVLSTVTAGLTGLITRRRH